MRTRQSPEPSTLIGYFLVAALTAAPACTFSPRFVTGVTKCSEKGKCPSGFTCTDKGVCCANEDHREECKASASETPDAAPPPLTPERADGGPVGPADTTANIEAVAAPRALEATRVVPFAVRLHECDTRGDQYWCVFTRGQELWVLNATAAAAKPVQCTGTDPNCVRLADGVFLADDVPSVVPRFSGQYLVYYANNLSIARTFRGHVYVWQPGWPTPKKVSSDDGRDCRGVDDSPSVLCHEAKDLEPGYELRVGDPNQGTPLLPVVKGAWLGFLSRDGTQLFYSQQTGAKAKQALYVTPLQLAADLTKRRMLTGDFVGISSLRKQTLMWILHDDLDPGDRVSATVSLFDRATAAQAQPLFQDVGEVRSIQGRDDADVGVAALRDVHDEQGQLELYFPGSPPITRHAGKTGGFAVSHDGRYVIVQPVMDSQTGNGDARLLDFQNGGSSCTLQALAKTYITDGEYFSDNGKLAFWVEMREADIAEVWLSRTDDCTVRRRLSPDMWNFDVVGDEGLVLYERTEDRSFKIAYLKWGDDMSFMVDPAYAAPDRVSDSYEVSVPQRLLVFQAEDPGKEGLYVAKLN